MYLKQVKRYILVKNNNYQFISIIKMIYSNIPIIIL